MRLTERDRRILGLVQQHRFLRSHQIIALIGESPQQVLRRLQLLFHNGYLERPRAQLDSHHRGGGSHIIYGLGDKGGTLLNQELGVAAHPVSWGEKNRAVGGMFLEHALLVSDVMVSLELACRRRGGVRLLYEDQPQPTSWRVKTEDGIRLGVIPDRVFALEYPGQGGLPERVHFFLEADRGTMPVTRGNLSQTSFARKLLAYEATWAQKVHQRQLGMRRFRVLSVTTSAARVKSLLEACSRLKRGHGLFFFAEKSVLEKDLFSAVWHVGKAGEICGMLDLPKSASRPAS